MLENIFTDDPFGDLLPDDCDEFEREEGPYDDLDMDF